MKGLGFTIEGLASQVWMKGLRLSAEELGFRIKGLRLRVKD